MSSTLLFRAANALRAFGPCGRTFLPRAASSTIVHYRSVRRALAFVLAVVACTGLTVFSFAAAFAQSATATITGRIIAQRGAFPIAGAAVTAAQAGKIAASAGSANDGTFSLAGLTPGLYDVTVHAPGYDASVSRDIAVLGGITTSINFALTQATTSTSGTVNTIGTVQARNSLAAAATISQALSLDTLTRTGQIRIADQLGTLPAVNFSSSSSVGDDASINLRGFSSDETAVLLDGHPVGPLGVGSGGFNMSLGPTYGLSSINVTYGSGAQGLYGNDTIGGAVNFTTLSPTTKPHASVTQQIGGFGLLRRASRRRARSIASGMPSPPERSVNTVTSRPATSHKALDPTMSCRTP